MISVWNSNVPDEDADDMIQIAFTCGLTILKGIGFY